MTRGTVAGVRMLDDWRRARLDRRAVRAEFSTGDGWLEYRRRRRAGRRALRAERKAEGRIGRDIQPDRSRAQAFGAYLSEKPLRRP
jgi:hypothetical protein